MEEAGREICLFLLEDILIRYLQPSFFSLLQGSPFFFLFQNAIFNPPPKPLATAGLF
jgi:hypothetical protein